VIKTANESNASHSFGLRGVLFFTHFVSPSTRHIALFVFLTPDRAFCKKTTCRCMAAGYPLYLYNRSGTGGEN
jgi:hypothetical protein